MSSQFPLDGRRRKRLAATAMTLGVAAALLPGQASAYSQFNLVSDLPGMAATKDLNLVNPWGMSSSATSPIWVSDNGSDLSTLYNGAGVPQALVVSIPDGAPTGQVFNNTAGFALPSGAASRFIFASENGAIDAWSGGSAAATVVPVGTVASAVYKGLAIGTPAGGGPTLYAANFNSGKIDVFNSSFGLSGSFSDSTIPAGFAPFNVQNIGGKLYVTYAMQDAAKHDDVAGAGNGFIDVFDLNGNLLNRLVSNGVLNSPWGLAMAPGNFGQFSHDLLVGNFGDGTINVFDPVTGAFLGTLDDPNGNPIVIEGLWGLLFGNGGAGGATNQLFFSAGIPGPDSIEDHGLFGDITVPEPSTMALLMAGMGFLAVRRRRT